MRDNISNERPEDGKAREKERERFYGMKGVKELFTIVICMHTQYSVSIKDTMSEACYLFTAKPNIYNP